MRHSLFHSLSLQGSVTEQVSAALSLGEYRAVQVSMVVEFIAGTGTPAVALALEASNDGESWRPVPGLSLSIPDVGYGQSGTYSGITGARIRARAFLQSGASEAIVSAELNFSNA